MTPAKTWLTFLQNHREVIVAFDFFTVPTVTFELLYCLFVIEHGRRKILHFNVPVNRRQIGYCNNYVRHSRRLDHIVTSFWIATRSSIPR